MKIENLCNMIPFFDFSIVEKISVDAIKHNFIAMKVDHMKGAVLFGQQVSLVFSCCVCFTTVLFAMHVSAGQMCYS